MRPLRWLSLVPVLVVLTLAAGCSRPLKDRLVGKWQETNGHQTVTFLKDGSVVYALGPVQSTGTYSTPDEKHVKFELSGLTGQVFGSPIVEAEMKDGRLVLDLAGKPTEFTRVE